MRIIKVLTNKDAKHFNKEAPKYEVIIAGFFMVNCPACKSFKPACDSYVWNGTTYTSSVSSKSSWTNK